MTCVSHIFWTTATGLLLKGSIELLSNFNNQNHCYNSHGQEGHCSLHANPLDQSPGQVKLDLDK